jgi:hypothetical protein
MSTNDLNGKEPDSDRPLEQGRQIEDGSRQMAELGVAFDGRYYRYKEYRYDILSDALNYAQLDRSRPTYRAEPYIQPPRVEPEQPTDEEQWLMVELAITFDGKCYCYGGYRYDHFVDAINYA